MSHVHTLTAQYIKHQPKSLTFARNPNANKYWIKHKLNTVAMSKLLSDISIHFTDRCDLIKAIAAAERKTAYWEKHENFNLSSAIIVFRAAKKIKISA